MRDSRQVFRLRRECRVCACISYLSLSGVIELGFVSKLLCAFGSSSNKRDCDERHLPLEMQGEENQYICSAMAEPCQKYMPSRNAPYLKCREGFWM